MSKYYVSNLNGDWWTMDTKNDTSLLFVISEEDLKAHLEDTIEETDKLERYIEKHGNAVHFIKGEN